MTPRATRTPARSRSSPTPMAQEVTAPASRSPPTAIPSPRATATRRWPISRGCSRPTESSTASSRPISRRSSTSPARPGPGGRMPTRRASSPTRRLRQFQPAAEIRDAFFRDRRRAPNISFEVKMLTLSGDAPIGDADRQRRPVVAQQTGQHAADCAMAGRRRRRRLDHARARHARPQVDARAHRRLGAVPARRRRRGDAARQRGQRRFRRRRARRLLPVQRRLAQQSAEPAGAAPVQMPERIVRRHARRTVRKTAGQARFCRRQRLAPFSRGLGALAAGRPGDVAPDARRGLDATSTTARRSGASGSAPTSAARR